MKSFNLRWSFLTSTGSLPFEYLVFFLVGTVPRAWRFGRYARPGRKGKPGTRPQDFVLPDFGCSRKLREANDAGERFEFNRWSCFLEARIVNCCSMTWSSSKHVELKRNFPPQKNYRRVLGSFSMWLIGISFLGNFGGPRPKHLRSPEVFSPGSFPGAFFGSYDLCTPTSYVESLVATATLHCHFAYEHSGMDLGEDSK